MSAPTATYAATATDACAGDSPVTFDIPSGSTFQLGTTTVTASASDGCGNMKTCTFTVTVYTSVVAHKFYDLNTDLSQAGAGEVPIAGWTFYLKQGANTPVSVPTDADGNAEFLLLTGGAYSLFEVLSGTWQNTTALSQKI